MSFARQVAEFCRRDLLTERRAGEVVSIVTPFGAVALMVFCYKITDKDAAMYAAENAKRDAELRAAQAQAN